MRRAAWGGVWFANPQPLKGVIQFIGAFLFPCPTKITCQESKKATAAAVTEIFQSILFSKCLGLVVGGLQQEPQRHLAQKPLSQLLFAQFQPP